MKTGIVLEIKGRIAVIMKNGGEFVEVRAKTGWQKGDIITLPNNTPNFKKFYVTAASFIFLLLCVFVGYQFYFTETLLISMDVNPSLELSINPFDRVISATSYNEDAVELLNAENIEGMPYQQAIDTLLRSKTLQSYLESKDYLEFAVYSSSDITEAIEYLNSCVQSITNLYPHVQGICNNANKTTVSVAHSYHMSIGKYLAFLELQELVPELQAEDYANCGMGEIRNQICHQHRNRLWKYEQENESKDSPQGSGNEYQHHGCNNGWN